MAKQKKLAETVRIVLHISTFKPNKGTRRKKAIVKKHRNKDGSYLSRIYRGNVTITSRKLYLPHGDNLTNDSRITDAINKYSKRFAGTKQKDFTANVQVFKGAVKDKFRARILGDISEGSRLFAVDRNKIKKQVSKINTLRRQRGERLKKKFPILSLTNEITNEISSRSADMIDRFSNVIIRKYPKGVSKRKPRRKKNVKRKSRKNSRR